MLVFDTRPKIGPYTGVIDRILEDDLNLPKKQRHTAKRIHERLREEYGFDGGYTIVKDYVRKHRAFPKSYKSMRIWEGGE